MITNRSRAVGICPVCNGSGRVPVPEHSQQYKHIIAGYDKETDTLGCSNCGGQYMYGKPTGLAPLRLGVFAPCTHSYKSQNVGRCLTRYICVHCDDKYDIDSGD